MKTLKVIILSSLILLAACSKNDVGTMSAPPAKSGDSTKTPPPVDSSYFITEDFEHGAKAGYADDTVDLKTGNWDLNNALIGNTTADSKIDTWSIRMQATGSITTTFKINGLKMIYVSSALYGSDAACSYQLQSSTDGTTFTQIGNTISVNSTTIHQDSFAITTTQPIQIRVTKSGGKRLNLDNIIFKGAGKSGIILDTTITNQGSGNYDTAAARFVVVKSGDIVPPSSGDNSNLLLGNISNADSTSGDNNNYLINQHYYIESYNASRGTPNWTAWHLDKNDIGSSGRNDDFAAWAGIKQGWYQVTPGDYTNSGYSRGHNCPSADRTASEDANDATFLMTNMIPQNQINNEDAWGGFENYIRTQVQNNNEEAYIVMGSYGNVKTIANGHVTVPTNIWKVVVFLNTGDNDISRIDANTRVIAINTPNDNTASLSWQSYIVTVKSIEDATGYNILSALNSQLKSVLENEKDSGK